MGPGRFGQNPSASISPSSMRWVPATGRTRPPVLETVRYSDLVHPAELKRNGELSLGTEAALRRGPWGLLYINDAEQISLLEEARALCSAGPISSNSVDKTLKVSPFRRAKEAKHDSLQVLDLDQRACKTWCSGHHDLMARIATKGQFSARKATSRSDGSSAYTKLG